MHNRRWVETVVKEALGQRRASSTSRRDLNRLVRKFVQAGRDAVRLETATATQAARILERITRRLSGARKRLAVVSAPGQSPVIVDRSWSLLNRTLLEHKDRLMQYPGVVGMKPGYRIRKGNHTDEPCITVLVRRKWSPETLKKRGHRRVPRSVRAPDGSQVRIDVVEFGRIQTQAAAGSSIGPRVDPAKGTLGAFGRHRLSGRPVAFTAMHVAHATLRDFPAPGVGDIEFVSPARSAAVFGKLLRGTRRRVDAAAIELLPPDQAQDPSPLRDVRGWRRLTFPGDKGTPVKLWGATSKEVFGVITDPGTFLDPAEFGIDFAIIADIPTQAGDSGGALLDGDNWVLGFLHGAAPKLGPNTRLFIPASSFLDGVGSTLP